ncbi:hypothetical protein LOC71_01565 [Rhodopirellula sp. JC740]|uniref:Uncharacterized protein n=1 Tax=Rhodopirellula halodulae TaxID=2894198 RepID=A0ABS8NBL3_9BACT|nr:hypothetical protein [Rhodopirellula sp. JC740]MCC9640943.1 hypothetical protein [Rhodopirellula sp. JC740]
MSADSDREQPSPADEAESAAAESGAESQGVAAGGDAEHQEPGCMPIVVACTLLMGIVSFIFCGVTTWVLFQKRTEVAVRTLEGYVPVIEQSLLPPDEKKSVVEQLEETIKQMRADDYPQEVASAVMQRLVRLPMPQYGELDAIESFAGDSFGEEERMEAEKQLSRLRRAIELGQATVIDVNDVLLPATKEDPAHPLGRVLKQPLSVEDVRSVVQRAKLIGDREALADQVFPRQPIDEILEKELAAARESGEY